ncbi:hypothetical protein GQ43DRAFT_475636 [Delitschia confertaspora ATCC 74209]|uniref:Membrane anchor Opy2 N-terminal domain-containing protein n=1 Tax=Delitschia confertaspora ATCC 74209 TaxID=1513339 RepID=A0A9P4JIP9_9PLEO|nr:hypothetical protein GQ43DRAFT_475636 [Delitschia confertaspora ATCC 74209]
MASITSRDVENVLRTVFRRCVQCPTDQIPACPPSCPTGQMCVQVPPSCNVCASTKCVATTADPTASDNTKDNGPNVGAIAGGVVGGVAFVAIMTFLVWKFYLKGRRRNVDEGDWQEANVSSEKVENDFASRRSARASTHTVASMASSVLTRASNIIQIAYIPGVTNRSGPGSPDLLVPPVPPIPIATSNSSVLNSPYSTSEQHFFVPDFRDSTYSGVSDGRSSYARTSIAPSLARSSVATTIYRNNAIVSPLPAQTIVRGKAAVVSVKSSGSNSPAETPGAETPPVPQVDPKHTNGNKPVRVQVLGLGSAAVSQGPVRALSITKRKKPAAELTPPTSASSAFTGTSSPDDTLVPPVRPLTEISVTSTDDGLSHVRARKPQDSEYDSDSDCDDHYRARKSLLRTSSNIRDSDITDIQDTPGMLQSPFSDSSHVDDSPVMQRHNSTFSGDLRTPLTPVMEESSKRGSRASKRTQSPFSDDNEVLN